MDFGAEPSGPEVLLDKTLFYLSAFSKRLGSPDLTLLVYKHQENDTHFSALEIKPQKMYEKCQSGALDRASHVCSRLFPLCNNT